MNELKISVENLSIVQPDFEYLSVISGEAWTEYNQQKFWLGFSFDGESLFYDNLSEELDLERNSDEFYEVDSEIFDSIINQLVERFPATLEELNRKRIEEEEENDDEL